MYHAWKSTGCPRNSPTGRKKTQPMPGRLDGVRATYRDRAPRSIPPGLAAPATCTRPVRACPVRTVQEHRQTRTTSGSLLRTSPTTSCTMPSWFGCAGWVPGGRRTKACTPRRRPCRSGLSRVAGSKSCTFQVQHNISLQKLLVMLISLKKVSCISSCKISFTRIPLRSS